MVNCHLIFLFIDYFGIHVCVHEFVCTALCAGTYLQRLEVLDAPELGL